MLTKNCMLQDLRQDVAELSRLEASAVRDLAEIAVGVATIQTVPSPQRRSHMQLGTCSPVVPAGASITMSPHTAVQELLAHADEVLATELGMEVPTSFSAIGSTTPPHRKGSGSGVPADVDNANLEARVAALEASIAALHADQAISRATEDELCTTAALERATTSLRTDIANSVGAAQADMQAVHRDMAHAVETAAEVLRQEIRAQASHFNQELAVMSRQSRAGDAAAPENSAGPELWQMELDRVSEALHSQVSNVHEQLQKLASTLHDQVCQVQEDLSVAPNQLENIQDGAVTREEVESLRNEINEVQQSFQSALKARSKSVTQIAAQMGSLDDSIHKELDRLRKDLGTMEKNLQAQESAMRDFIAAEVKKFISTY